MFARAADDIGAPAVAKKLREGAENWLMTTSKRDERDEILNPLRKMVLNTAKRFGKARFAQIAARHVDQATSIPNILRTRQSGWPNHDADGGTKGRCPLR